jgi:phage terminase small subunit
MGPEMMLADEKWERFCQAVADGQTATDAYLAAGFAVKDRVVAKANAWRLLKHDKIKQRLGELQGWLDERISVSKELFESKLAQEVERQANKIVADINWITAQLVDAHEEAKRKNDIAGRCRALELLGKSRGMFVDKTETSNVNYAVSDTPMSAEQWAKKYADDEKKQPDTPVSAESGTKH